MSSIILKEIMQRSIALDDDEKLELIAHLAHSVRGGEEAQSTQIRWSDIEGTVPHPMPGEDAPQQVERSREEGERLDALGWPVGFFEETYGSLADDPIERLPQGELEVREAIL